MKSMSCEISFLNNPSKVFYSGQMLSGIAAINVIKPKTVKGIYVKIIGRAYCRWTSGSGHHCKSHFGEEFYLNEKTFFVGDDDERKLNSNGNEWERKLSVYDLKIFFTLKKIFWEQHTSDEVILPPSQYNYTFSCMLPTSLPTSVEGNVGYIRYSVSVHIDKPMWPHQRFQEYFTVIKALNLNDEIMLRCPLVKEERNTFFTCGSLFCCKSGPLIMRGSVPVRGYVPGQTIDFLLEINNCSAQSVQNFIIQFVKHIQYYTHANSANTKCDKTIIRSTTCSGCPKNQSKTYILSIAVPSVPPTESTSNIVKVSYRLQIHGSVGCFHEDPVLVFPLKVGTFPIVLGDFETAQPSTESRTENYGNQFDSTALIKSTASSTVPSEIIDSIDPPTYEEAISSGCSIEAGFRPSYPVFRRSPSYAVKPES